MDSNVFKNAKIVNNPSSVISSNEPIWTDRKGKKIPVSKMATPHIKNTLRMLREKGFIGPSDLQFYINYPPPNGDMALLAFEQEFERILESPISNFIGIFESELRKRGAI